MKEIIIKQTLENYFINQKIPFERSVSIKNSSVDFVFDRDGKKHFAIIKSSRAKLHSTIGQLISAKRTCSSIFLIAPSGFIKNFQQATAHSRDLTDVGLITLVKGNLTILRQSSSEGYYLNEYQQAKNKPQMQKEFIITKDDMKIVSNFPRTVFLISDVAKLLNVKLSLAQRKVMRLKQAKVVEEVASSYPKGFRICIVPEKTTPTDV